MCLKASVKLDLKVYTERTDSYLFVVLHYKVQG